MISIRKVLMTPTLQLLILLLTTAVLAALVWWRSPPATQAATAKPAAAAVHPSSWGYQLQDLDLADAAASPFDLLVIDPTRDGSDATAFTPAEIARLKTMPDGRRRRVFAYLSIGEAERYRSYWKPAWEREKPVWLLDENPDWPENHSVCFWHPDWQDIICAGRGSRLARIIAAGFDGVYLDKCDVFEDLRAHHPKLARTRPDLESDMAAFIVRIARFVRSTEPSFAIVMQNAESLLSRPPVRGALDGVAKEDLLYGISGAETKNSADDVEWSCEQLDRMRRDGKFVLVVEYLDASAKIAAAARLCRDRGYTLYISDKSRRLAKFALDFPLPVLTGRDQPRT
jgi:cysteinyl-tRNA synthetase